MKNTEYFKLIGYVLITFIVVWALSVISNKCFDIGIDSDTAIISFIGIIATFIVVGNYSQVAEMRNQAFDQTKNYNFKIEEFDAKLKEIDKLREIVEAKEKNIEKLQSEFYYSQIENNILLCMQHLRTESYPTSFYLIKSAFILLPKIEFNDVYNNVIELLILCINKVDNKAYKKTNSDEISNIIKKLKKVWEIDVKQLKELEELIKNKNIEYGYSTVIN